MGRLAKKVVRNKRQVESASLSAIAAVVQPGETTIENVPKGQRPHVEATRLEARADGATLVAQAQAQNGRVDPSVLDTIVEKWRQRQMLVRAETALINQVKSYARRLCHGDKAQAVKLFKRRSPTLVDGNSETLVLLRAATMPLELARAPVHAVRLEAERWLEKAAQELPAADFVRSVHGFGWLGLAAIVGEAGDLANYATEAKLWRRFGLAVFDGAAERPRKGDVLGFSPARRTVIWTIGTSLIKQQNRYQALYLKRKEYELARDIILIAAHKRAQRYVEKALLRHLWKAWRQVGGPKTSIPPMEPVNKRRPTCADIVS